MVAMEQPVPGPELDAAVAEALGWTECAVVDGRAWGCPFGRPGQRVRIPPWSTDVRASYYLRALMRARGYQAVTFGPQPEHPNSPYHEEATWCRARGYAVIDVMDPFRNCLGALEALRERGSDGR